MKIIIISDIHANLPALEAAWESIDLQQPDVIYCLGDLVGYNIWPNEVIDSVRSRRIPVISGNHDAKAVRISATDDPVKNYAYQIINPAGKSYLASLPAFMRVEFQLNEEKLVLLLVHGSPYSNEEYLLETKPEEEFLEIFRNSDADIICSGHSHLPYFRVIRDGDKCRFALNSGSVGKPKDGDPRGGYIVLSLSEHSRASQPSSLNVEIIRFDYDVEKAARAIEDSPLPDVWAALLRNGGE